jgi:hypothetical protein
LIGQQNHAIFAKNLKAFAYRVVLILKGRTIAMDFIVAAKWPILAVL